MIEVLLSKDLNNKHVKNENKYKTVHGELNFINRNDIGQTVLEFASTNDFELINTFCKQEHLVTSRVKTIRARWTIL